MLVDHPARRLATTGALGLLLGACPVLSADDLAAQSEMPASHAGPVVREIEGGPPAVAPAGDPGQAGASEASPFAELNEALAAARAKLEELSAAADVAASVGQLRRELDTAHERNQQLQAELASLRASRGELESAGEAAQARIAELIAETGRLGDEVGGLRDSNAELRTEIETSDEALRKAAEQSGAEVVAMRERLQASEQEVAAVTADLKHAEARVEELQGAVAASRQVAAELREELAHARDAVSSAARDRQDAQATIADLQAEAGQLRDRLASAEDRTSRLEAANASLDAELQAFQTAASNATDAARQNLEAVESRVEALTAALTTVEATPEPEAALDRMILESRPAELGQPEVTAAAAGAELGASRDTAGAVADPASQPVDGSPVHGRIQPGGFDSDLARAKGDGDLFQTAGLAADLPLERRLQIQGLLSELKPAVDQRGLRLTVPGASLFRVDSDDIEETAYETLAKLAELINVYDDRSVLIVGHTDSIGDAAYNQMLSERRADLVKQFFVDNFEIDAARVATEGKGEEAPIASNSTNAGRKANRRVEVLLLN